MRKGMHSLVRRIPMALGPLVGGLFISVWGERDGVRVAFGAAFIMAAVALIMQQRMIEADTALEANRGDACEPTPEKNLLKLLKLMNPSMKKLLITDILITAFAFGVVGTIGFTVFGRDVQVPIYIKEAENG